MSHKVDCVINAFGKPYQTELALLSLMRYSGEHIDRIYLINENAKVSGHGHLRNALGNIKYYETKFIHWVNPLDLGKMTDDDYRRSVRYQYGWEMSDKDFIFITHNDCVYHGDIVGALLEGMSEYMAVGQIGQCWNCPAWWSEKCRPDSYWSYRPSFDELSRLYNESTPPEGRSMRPYNVPSFHETFIHNPWPLPECRVNEWCALVNLSSARKVTMPGGPAAPFGAIMSGGTPILDIGVSWFRDISHMGYECRNFPIYKYMSHSAGHPAMFDEGLYMTNEKMALEILKKEYGRTDNGYRA